MNFYKFFCSLSAVLFLVLFLTVIIAPLSASAMNQKESDNVSSLAVGAPVYKPPVKNAEIRRREGGETRGLTRGLIRGLIRGNTRGLTRGYIRGLTRGLTRGLIRGENRGLIRGLIRGENRGLIRGLIRGENRGLIRGLIRGENRGLIRGLIRGENRGLIRGLIRGENRGLTRGLTRGLIRGLARGLTRGLIRSENRGLIRGLIRGLEKESILAPIPSRMVPLASEHTGLATKSRPVLLWYISDPWPGKIEFTVNKVGEPDPLFQTHIDGPEKEGVYQIRLADYDVTLEHDTEYEWFLAIIVDPYERSADFLASATVRYVKPSDDLSNLLDRMPENELHRVYAENGYWYDMIESLSKLIADESPKYKQLRAQRGALLRQVNLPLAGAYDMN